MHCDMPVGGWGGGGQSKLYLHAPAIADDVGGTYALREVCAFAVSHVDMHSRIRPTCRYAWSRKRAYEYPSAQVSMSHEFTVWRLRLYAEPLRRGDAGKVRGPCVRVWKLDNVLGLAWLGLAWLGLAWLGLSWLGLGWFGLVWCGLVWCGFVHMLWFGLVWLGWFTALRASWVWLSCWDSSRTTVVVSWRPRGQFMHFVVGARVS